MQNYKSLIFESYRSNFKGASSQSLRRSAALKLESLIKPWTKDIPRDASVVDLGCGAGELLLAFRHLGFENISGCDLSLEQIEMAREVSSKVEVCDLSSYLERLPDESTQLITLFDVIEHLTKQESMDVCRLIYSKLKPGGLFIGHTPNGSSPLVGQVFFSDLTHEWCPNPVSIRLMLSVLGYNSIESVEHLGNSHSLVGTLRAYLWQTVRLLFTLVNKIETGHSGCGVWTRNFAFKAQKP